MRQILLLKIEDLQKKVSGSKIEYFNRLVGLILGLSMLYTFKQSFSIFNKDKIILKFTCIKNLI